MVIVEGCDPSPEPLTSTILRPCPPDGSPVSPILEKFNSHVDGAAADGDEFLIL